MDAPHSQLDRIEQLLRDGNELRRRAIGLQEQSFALQQSLIDEQRANLARAAQVNEQALLIQQRARRIISALVPVLLVAAGFLGYLLFFRSYG